MGASVDLVSQDLRRSCQMQHIFTGLSVPENADVDYVDPFYASFYGFIRDKGSPGQPCFLAYGLENSSAPDQLIAPKWNFSSILIKNKIIYFGQTVI